MQLKANAKQAIDDAAAKKMKLTNIQQLQEEKKMQQKQKWMKK